MGRAWRARAHVGHLVSRNIAAMANMGAQALVDPRLTQSTSSRRVRKLIVMPMMMELAPSLAPPPITSSRSVLFQLGNSRYTSPEHNSTLIANILKFHTIV